MEQSSLQARRQSFMHGVPTPWTAHQHPQRCYDPLSVQPCHNHIVAGDVYPSRWAHRKPDRCGGRCAGYAAISCYQPPPLLVSCPLDSCLLSSVDSHVYSCAEDGTIKAWECKARRTLLDGGPHEHIETSAVREPMLSSGLMARPMAGLVGQFYRLCSPSPLQGQTLIAKPQLRFYPYHRLS